MDLLGDVKIKIIRWADAFATLLLLAGVLILISPLVLMLKIMGYEERDLDISD